MGEGVGCQAPQLCKKVHCRSLAFHGINLEVIQKGEGKRRIRADEAGGE
jgi:hypothetical protein